jgi:hypothetical protein
MNHVKSDTLKLNNIELYGIGFYFITKVWWEQKQYIASCYTIPLQIKCIRLALQKYTSDSTIPAVHDINVTNWLEVNYLLTLLRM